MSTRGTGPDAVGWGLGIPRGRTVRPSAAAASAAVAARPSPPGQAQRPSAAHGAAAATCRGDRQQRHHGDFCAAHPVSRGQPRRRPRGEPASDDPAHGRDLRSGSRHDHDSRAMWRCSASRTSRQPDEVQELAERRQLAHGPPAGVPDRAISPQHPAHRRGGREQRADREDDDPVAQLPQPVQADRRGLAALGPVEQQRHVREGPGGLGGLVLGRRRASMNRTSAPASRYSRARSRAPLQALHRPARRSGR